MIGSLFTLETLTSALQITTPLILAAIGGSICIKAGVFNIAIEGFLLIGSFIAVLVASSLANAYLGVLAAIIMGAIFGFLFGFFTLTLKADEIITGLGINMFALGITTWFLADILNSPGAFVDPRTPGLPRFNMNLFEQIPVLGEILRTQNIIDLSAWILAIVAFILMHRSIFGLRMRAIGEYPEAPKTAGISVIRNRYVAIVISGMLGGLGGAHMSLAALRFFSENMSAGRGFIAFTAVVFSGGNIIPATFLSFLFGIFESVAIRLEGYGISTYFIQMIPYVMTIFILFLSAIRLFRKKHYNNSPVE